MKKFRIVVLIALLAIAAPLVIRHRVWALGSPQSGSGATRLPLTATLEIVSPRANQKLAQTFVTVQYHQLMPASASSTPTFELRLDGQDPVQTTDTSYTFNGLTPGNHNVIVQAIDANGMPITGTRSEIKFVSVNPASGSASDRQAQSLPELPPPQTPNNGNLPSGNSSLPLLSVIGFGILVGGVISALRTRPAHK